MLMDNDYKEIERVVIRERGDNLLVKVKGLYMDKYHTQTFEFWSSKEAYEQKKYCDGNKIYCANWAVSEETALNNWEGIINTAK